MQMVPTCGAQPNLPQNTCVELSNAPPQPLHTAPGASEDGAAEPPADAPAGALRGRRAVALMRQSVCEVLSHVENSHLAEEEHVTRLGFALKVRADAAVCVLLLRGRHFVGCRGPWCAVVSAMLQGTRTRPACAMPG
jgi:hypothetical protein